jgi:hypothetical protein
MMKDDLLEKHLRDLFSDAVLPDLQNEEPPSASKQLIRPKWAAAAIVVLLVSFALVFAALSTRGRSRIGSEALPDAAVADPATRATPSPAMPTAGGAALKLTVAPRRARLAAPVISQPPPLLSEETSIDSTATIIQPAAAPTLTAAGQPPVAPSDLQTTAIDSTHVRLDWSDNSSNELGFGICEGNNCMATAGTDATSYTVGDLAPNSYHCYRLYAFNDYGNSSWTDWACVNSLMPTVLATTAPQPTSTPTLTATPAGEPPAAPSNVRATLIEATHIRLEWDDNSDNEAGFGVCDGDACLGTTGADATSYTIGGLDPHSYHCYQIYAFNRLGDSPLTDWTCVTTAFPTASPSE